MSHDVAKIAGEDSHIQKNGHLVKLKITMYKKKQNLDEKIDVHGTIL